MYRIFFADRLIFEGEEVAALCDHVAQTIAVSRRADLAAQLDGAAQCGALAARFIDAASAQGEGLPPRL